jgi:CheY-like chemotaxis protein
MTAGDERGVDLLLVEDNPDDARFVQRLVSNYQSETEPRETTGPIVIDELDHVDRLVDGLDRVQRRTPDAILLDLMLPDSSGLETVDRMVERAPAVPIVVLTGHDETEIGVEAIQRGAEEYLVKGSITATVLVRTLRYAIERKRNQRELLDRNHRLALLNRIIRTDIRNDASMIVGRGDQLRDRVDSSDEAALEALLDAAEHLVELTDTSAGLMDVLSPDDLQREPRDLNAVLDAAVTRVRRESDVPITIERTDAVDDPMTVYGTPMLESAFTHLLSTVVDSAHRESSPVSVRVDASNDRVSVAIAGDRVRLPDAQRELLVNPPSRYEDGARMGIGLYLVTTVLEDVDGEIAVEDTYAAGTTVTTTFERVRRS